MLPSLAREDPECLALGGWGACPRVLLWGVGEPTRFSLPFKVLLGDWSWCVAAARAKGRNKGLGVGCRAKGRDRSPRTHALMVLRLCSCPLFKDQGAGPGEVAGWLGTLVCGQGVEL